MYKANKKNILIVSGFLPFPLNMGGRIRIHTLCRLLSDRYNFILLSLIKDESEFNYIPELKAIFKEVFLVLERSQRSGLLYPDSYKGSYSKGMIKKFNEIIKTLPIDIIHIEFNELLYLTEYSGIVPTIYTEHDVSALFLRNSYYRPIGIFPAFDYLKRLRLHMNLYKKLGKIIAVSEFDREFLKRLIPFKKIHYLPTGVDLDYFHFLAQNENSTQLIFTGWYLHYPNEDAILYFAKKTFPIIKKKMPESEFFIVGRDPTEKILRLNNKNGIKVVGAVGDVRIYLKDSAVFVNPIRLGAGIKSKILEAMATGVPVVSTSRGAMGISAINNKEILISDNPQGFADSTMRLCYDITLRQTMAKNARKLVEERYNWKMIADRLDKIYEEVSG